MAISFSRPRIVDLIGWGLLAVALLFALYVRVRLREFPLERDEGEFAYAGQLILQGVPPYKLAYNMKLPGTYIAYAALMAVFGQTTPGIHLGLLAVNLATIWLLYRFTRELFDPFSAGMAALVYAILSVSPALLGMAAHATHFVAFFGLAGAYLLWRHLQSGSLWQAAASGLLMGIAFLMKQQGVFLMVFGGVLLLWLGLRLATYPRKRLLLALPLYSVAAVLPYGLICLWLWRAGVWEKFWFWTVEYASKYVAVVPLSLAGAYLWQSGSRIVEANWPLLLLALGGIAGTALILIVAAGGASRACGASCSASWSSPFFALVRAITSASIISSPCCPPWRCWPAWVAGHSWTSPGDSGWALRGQRQLRVIMLRPPRRGRSADVPSPSRPSRSPRRLCNSIPFGRRRSCCCWRRWQGTYG